MEQDFEELVYSEQVLGFNVLANEYCNFLDGAALLTQKEFVDKAHRLLPLLYLKALVLPDLEPIMPEMIEKEVTQEEWEAVAETVARKLQTYDEYNEVLDALSNQQDEMTSLSEGFADIFQDLRDYLALYNMGTPEMMNDAIWECKKNFGEYWGQRLVNILRVLHYLLYGGTQLNESDALTHDDFDPEKRIKKDWDLFGHRADFGDDDDEDSY